jgi:signal transduction histidine kinase
VLFVFAAAAAIAISAALAYRGVRIALESDLAGQLVHLAGVPQVTAGDVREIRLLGDEANAYLDVQTQLSTLRAATAVKNVSLTDSAGVVLFDAESRTREGETSPLDSVAPRTFAAARGGATGVSPPYTRDGVTLRAGYAPILSERRGGHPVGFIAVEAQPSYLRTLDELQSRLVAIALVTVLAIGLLALLLARQALSAARLERRLSRAENLAAMGRLTATLAHEIKNPLAIIRGSAARLEKLDPEAQRMAGFVIEESDRLSRTVARYLQFARGEEDPAAETGDAVRTLEATLDLLEGEARARGIAVERVGAFPAAARVGLDNESLKQLYLNLALNALEAMGKGGRLRIGCAERGGKVEVTFADDGPGMAPEVLEKAGNPFFTTKAGGSGLGLFLARRLARSAGGELTIRSPEGGGVTCQVRLPRRKD